MMHQTNSPHEANSPNEKEVWVTTTFSQLPSKMTAAAGDHVKMLLAGIWQEEEDLYDDKDPSNGEASKHLQRRFRKLLEYLDNRCDKPPAGWEALANVAMGAALAQPGASQPVAPVPLQSGVRNVHQFLSNEPVWKLPKAVDGTPLFPEPPLTHTQSHRCLNGVLSGMRKGSQEQTILAHVYMHIHYSMHKQSTIFSETIPMGEHAGGPYPVARETHRAAPADPLKHVEVIVDGEMQKAKSPETADQAWTFTFIEGVACIIYVRVRGGGEVGSRDMKSAIDSDAGMNGEVRRALAAILPHYGYQTGEAAPQADKEKFDELYSALRLQPRVTSFGETLEFDHNGALKGGNQVLISCINTKQLEALYVPRDKLARKWRESGGCTAPLLTMFGGGVIGTTAAGAPRHSPYPKYRHDPSAPPDSGANRETPRLALLFDEDDVVKSATGKGAAERVVYDALASTRKDIERATMGFVALEEEAQPDADEVAARNEIVAFNQRLDSPGVEHMDPSLVPPEGVTLSLRAAVSFVVGYTATPGSEHYDIAPALSTTVGGAGSRPVSEAEVHTVHMPTPPQYIGYNVGRAQQEPWRRHHVQIERMADRVRNLALKTTVCAMTLFRKLGFDEGEVPEPWFWAYSRSAGRHLRMKPKSLDVAVALPDGKEVPAREIRAQIQEMQRSSKTRADKFDEVDGINVRQMLLDMQRQPDGAVEPFRMALIHNNFTRTDVQKADMAQRLLNLDESFSKGCFTIEYSGKYVRISWRSCDHDRDALGGIKDQLLREAKRKGSAVLEQFLEHGSFFDGAQDDETEDDDEMAATWPSFQLVSFYSPCANINAALDLLKAYFDFRRREVPHYKQLMVPIAGEIGARGVRYKGLSHDFYLTDMYYSFDTTNVTQVSVHGAQAAQAIGRLCTLLKDDTELFVAPKLWIPRSSWEVCELFLGAFHELPTLARLKQPGESTRDAMCRLLRDNAAQAAQMPCLNSVYSAITGKQKNGKVLQLQLNHQKQKGAECQRLLALENERAGNPRRDIGLRYSQDDVDSKRAEATAALAAQALHAYPAPAVAAALSDSDSEVVAAEEEVPLQPEPLAGPMGSVHTIPRNKAAEARMPSRPAKKAKRVLAFGEAAPSKRQRHEFLKEGEISAVLPNFTNIKHAFRKAMDARAEMDGHGTFYAKDLASCLQYCALAVVAAIQSGAMPPLADARGMANLSGEQMRALLVTHRPDSVGNGLAAFRAFVAFAQPAGGGAAGSSAATVIEI